MPKSKLISVFMGPMECPDCGNISIHHSHIDKSFNNTAFIMTSLPILNKHHYITCSYCASKRKINKKEKELYKKAIENDFDDEGIVEKFYLTCKDIINDCEVIENDDINEEKLNIAIDKLYNQYKYKQGYDRSFYAYFCEIEARRLILKKHQNSILYRNKEDYK